MYIADNVMYIADNVMCSLLVIKSIYRVTLTLYTLSNLQIRFDLIGLHFYHPFTDELEDTLFAGHCPVSSQHIALAGVV